jgi:hypothetical protein
MGIAANVHPSAAIFNFDLNDALAIFINVAGKWRGDILVPVSIIRICYD